MKILKWCAFYILSISMMFSTVVALEVMPAKKVIDGLKAVTEKYTQNNWGALMPLGEIYDYILNNSIGNEAQKLLKNAQYGGKLIKEEIVSRLEKKGNISLDDIYNFVISELKRYYSLLTLKQSPTRVEAPVSGSVISTAQEERELARKDRRERLFAASDARQKAFAATGTWGSSPEIADLDFSSKSYEGPRFSGLSSLRESGGQDDQISSSAASALGSEMDASSTPSRADSVRGDLVSKDREIDFLMEQMPEYFTDEAHDSIGDNNFLSRLKEEVPGISYDESDEEREAKNLDLSAAYEGKGGFYKAGKNPFIIMSLQKPFYVSDSTPAIIKADLLSLYHMFQGMLLVPGGERWLLNVLNNSKDSSGKISSRRIISQLIGDKPAKLLEQDSTIEWKDKLRIELLEKYFYQLEDELEGTVTFLFTIDEITRFRDEARAIEETRKRPLTSKDAKILLGATAVYAGVGTYLLAPTVFNSGVNFVTQALPIASMLSSLQTAGQWAFSTMPSLSFLGK